MLATEADHDLCALAFCLHLTFEEIVGCLDQPKGSRNGKSKIEVRGTPFWIWIDVSVVTYCSMVDSGVDMKKRKN